MCQHARGLKCVSIGGDHNKLGAEQKEKKGKKGKKEKKEKKERERKEGKREGEERGRERGRKGSRRSDGLNSLDQGVKSGDSTRDYASRGKDSSYFCLLLVFGLLFSG